MRFFVVTLCANLACASTAAATIILTVPDVVASAGQGGTFEVFVQNDSAAPNLAGFQFQLSVTPSPGVTFSGVSAPTVHPYVFAAANPGGPISSPAGSSSISAGDFLLTGSAPLGNNVGLAKLQFQLAANAALGLHNLTINPSSAATFFVDSSSQPIPFQIHNGSLTVVPEPSGLLLGAFAFVGLWMFWRSHQTRSPLLRC